jgi:hypothetical protein
MERKESRTRLTMKAKIDEPGGTELPTASTSRRIEKKPPCDVCGSMLHGLTITRSMVENKSGANFYCPVATREEARSDQLEPCPLQIARYYQYDETCLSIVFRDMREKGYGRFVNSSTMDKIENQTREICREGSDTNLPKRRKVMTDETDNQSLLGGAEKILDIGEKVSKG